MAEVIFREERCKGCKLCISVCPMKIIYTKVKLNKKGYYPSTVTEIDKCIGCGNCATICPDCVITVEK
ncbi:MAG: 4Fe-4S binding protein [Clostridiales bacterium]